MKTGALIGAVLAAVVSCVVGSVAWLTDPLQYVWFIGPGEIFAFLFLKGDSYTDYRDMSRHGIPAAIVIYTIAGMMFGGVLGMLVKRIRWRAHRALTNGCCPKV